MLLLRLLVDAPKLEEATRGGERRDSSPQQHNGADLGELAKGAVDHQQNEEHIKFADLRHAFGDVAGGQQRRSPCPPQKARGGSLMGGSRILCEESSKAANARASKICETAIENRIESSAPHVR